MDYLIWAVERERCFTESHLLLPQTLLNNPDGPDLGGAAAAGAAAASGAAAVDSGPELSSAFNAAFSSHPFANSAAEQVS